MKTKSCIKCEYFVENETENGRHICRIRDISKFIGKQDHDCKGFRPSIEEAMKEFQHTVINDIENLIVKAIILILIIAFTVSISSCHKPSYGAKSRQYKRTQHNIRRHGSNQDLCGKKNVFQKAFHLIKK